MRPSLGVFLSIAPLLFACGESSVESTPADAGVDAEAIVDPNCHDGDWRSAPPTGSCVKGASCKLYVQYSCEPGVKYISGTQDYSCNCATGQWDCTHTGGALTLIPCDAGASDAMPD